MRQKLYYFFYYHFSNLWYKIKSFFHFKYLWCRRKWNNRDDKIWNKTIIKNQIVYSKDKIFVKFMNKNLNIFQRIRLFFSR